MTLSSERRYDLDWLRVLGVLLLIPFHVALIFVLDPNAIMYIKDVVNSRVLEVAAGFVHMWHMPMLFIISGSATYFALGFRSARQYIRERFLRLFIPLVLGILTFVPFTTYIQHSNILSLQEGYIGYFHFDLNHLDGLNGTFTPAHLWFILYLFVFSLIGLPLFQALRSGKGKGVIKALGTLTQAPLSLMVWGIPLTLVAALNMLGDKNPLYYFLIYFYGFVLAGDARFQQSIDKLTWVALASGVFAVVINMLMPIQSYTEWTVQWMALGLMYEMGRWALTLAVLGLGHRFLNRTSNLLRYASEAAMPFYLLHMTFSVLTGYFAIQLDAPVAVKYPLIVLVATGSTLVAYELVRRWNMTRWLFGMKPIRQGMPVASNAKLDRQPL
ncbi:MAG TPA: acyltransferase family protein [Anaerolineales bacterium]